MKPGTFIVRLGEKLRSEPGALFEMGVALARGTFYAVYYRLFHRNVRIALPFLAHCRVSIAGPGTVRIGPWSAAFLNAFDGLTISTSAADAVVSIGTRCRLGGLTVRCSRSVSIGDGVMCANALVQDALFHTSAPAVLSSNTASLAQPAAIVIDSGAWLASQTVVLAGSRLGESSVLGRASVCYQLTVPAARAALGNPASSSLSVGRLDSLLRRA